MQSLLALIKFYKETRQLTEQLCKPLELEDYLSQPEEFVSPPKWHLAHTTWFFEVVILKAHNKKYKLFNDKFLYLFNSYYNALGNRTLRNRRGNQTRPTIKEVYEYRSYVDYELVKFLEANPEKLNDIIYFIELGINHEKQHQELLLTDIKYILFQNPEMPLYTNITFPDLESQTFLEEFYEIPEGIYQIGYDGPDFHFDNETGLHKYFLHASKLQQTTVTNAEYIDFIESGAYKDFRLWLSEGWEWIKKYQIDAPLYWEKIDGDWYYFTLYGRRKVDGQLPVTHVSYYEADAFASWSGKRLPLEEELEMIAKTIVQEKPLLNCLEKETFTPIVDVGSQILGNVWEWSNSAYLAYPYFRKAKGIVEEYNGKFMANQMVLRGGSCVTPFSQIRPSYRNFFYLHERWQFTGIRLAENN